MIILCSTARGMEPPKRSITHSLSILTLQTRATTLSLAVTYKKPLEWLLTGTHTISYGKITPYIWCHELSTWMILPAKKRRHFCKKSLLMSSEPETIQDMQARANNILDARRQIRSCKHRSDIGQYDPPQHNRSQPTSLVAIWIPRSNGWNTRRHDFRSNRYHA